MKILLIMDPGILVPPVGYGGHERLVAMFATEYKRQGHEVHLLVTPGSFIEGCTIHPFGKAGFPPKKKDARKAILYAWKFLRKRRIDFDLIHNFGRLAYLLPVMLKPIPKIMTYGREISGRNIRYINFLSSKKLFFTGCSANLLSRVNTSGNWEVVYNAVEFAKYTLQENLAENAPLIFLGRLERVKGCHIAIEVALATGNKLIIAGNVSPMEEEQIYFKKEVEPFIDGVNIQYVGQVNDEEKNEWLGKAKALLFPITWNEPFGIVMIEAMACGTPVIAFNRGSVDEVIDDGITGFKVDTKEQMIEAVPTINMISRASCRQYAMDRFDVKVIAKRYLDIIDERRKRIVIISTHQPAANPRALKEYETLKKEGYLVKHLYTYNADWSYRVDQEKFSKGLLARQDFIEIGGNPHKRPFRYFMSRLRRRLFGILSNFIPACKEMATEKAAFEIWRLSSKYPAHLYIAHYLGSLPGAVKASRKHKAKLIFDAEDFHRGELSFHPSRTKDVITVEDALLPEADVITTASPLITAAYKKNYPGIKMSTVNNVFSAKFLQPLHNSHEKKLRLFWFSQHIGMYRGLEIFVEALNYLPGANITLTIMGNTWSESYNRDLLALSSWPEKIYFQEPVSPEDIFSIAAEYDVGLAGEIPNCFNRQICLTNKIFTYLLAGNCILASDVLGQKEFMEQYTGIGFIYKNNNAKDLADKISTIYQDRSLLQGCKKRSLELAAAEMNWEHESKKWLVLIRQLLGKENVTSTEKEKAVLRVQEPE